LVKEKNSMNFYPLEIKFRNASGEWGSLAEQAIKIVSPNRIHVEGKFPDHLPEAYKHLEGKSFSSSSAKEGIHGGNGVRIKAIQYSHPERWTTYILWITKEELEDILFDCECLAATGQGYDFRGAAGCAVTGKENPWLWFCSEVVFDRIVTKWFPARLNYKMHPDKLEQLVIILEAKLLERKFKVEGV